MQQIEDNALCLRTLAYAEHDIIATCLGSDLGVFTVRVRSAKKPTSKLVAATEQLTLNHLLLAPGRSMYTLCHTDRVQSFSHIRESLEKLAASQVVMTLLSKLGRPSDEDAPALFDLATAFLAQMDSPKTDWAAISVKMHVDLLTLAGYLPDFSQCFHCQTAFAQTQSVSGVLGFFPHLHAVACSSCAQLSHPGQRIPVSVATIQALMAPGDSPLNSDTALRVHRFLAYYWALCLESSIEGFSFLLEVMAPQGVATELG